MISCAHTFVRLSFPSFCPLFFSFLILFFIATFVLMVDQRHRNAVFGFGFGLLGREYSSERVVTVLAVCARTAGNVYYDRAFGCCRTLTPVYCCPCHPSFLCSFHFFFRLFFTIFQLLFWWTNVTEMLWLDLDLDC